MRDIPPGWSKTTLGDVADVVGGGTPDTKKPSNFSSHSGYAWLTPADLTNFSGVHVSRGRRNLSPEGLSASSARLIPAGTVLMSSRAPIGHLAIAANEMSTSQGFKSFVSSRGVLPEYVFWWLRHKTPLIRAMASGSTFPEISGSRAKTIPIFVPPHREQRLIVVAIEDLVSRLDEAGRELSGTHAKSQRFRASILNAAVIGRLVPTEAQIAREEGREYEPADVLLARILRKRRQRWEEAELAKVTAPGRAPRDDWKKRYAEPIEPDTSSLPELPEGWCWATLDMLIQAPLSNGRSVTTADNGFPVLRLTAIGRSIDLHETKIGNWSREMAEPFLVRSGDFLIARGNGSLKLVGRGGLVPAIHEDVAFPDTMIRARLGDEIVREFVAIVWDSQFVRQQIATSAKTTAGIYKVNQRDLERIVLPIAPRSEQRRIVEAFDDSDAQAHVAAASVRINSESVAALRQSILRWAFEGKLVDQDPNDEPASELIARIRAERTARQPVRTRRGAQPAEPRRTPGKRRQTPPR